MNLHVFKITFIGYPVTCC